MQILLVDDNKEITEMVSFYLESLGDVECTAVNSGKECLDIIGKRQLDLIILDLAMPELSGVDVINHLVKTGQISDLNIVVCTASSISDIDMHDLRKTGIKDILRKPMSLDSLAEITEKFRPIKKAALLSTS